jgi:hypothetical protein
LTLSARGNAERLFVKYIFPNSKNSIFPTNKQTQMAPLSLVAGDALVKLIASARSVRHNNPRGFVLALSFASLSLLFLLTATHYSDSFSPGTKDDEDAVLSYEDEDDEKRTREKTDVENNYQYENRSEKSGFLWWEGAANVALACACAATIGILVAARRARKIFLSSSSQQQQQRVEGQSATAGIGKESVGGKSWNGSQWVDATAPSVLSSPYRNSSGGGAAAAARPPDANWAKAKGVGAWSSENGSKNNSNDNEDDGTDFATGFGYSEGVSSETARERAYRETLWARREAEELEAEENEEDQRNHHEYFTKHDDDDDDDNGHRNRSNSSRKSSASTSSAPRKEKESAAAKRERRWSKFDQRWESLDASAATSRLPLTYNDIPWPPKMAKLLDRKVSEHEKKSSSSSSSSSAGGGSAAAAAAAKKKIYRELLLRWHPDKFMQKYGKRVRAGGDEDRIKERVDAVAKALSASMAS